MKGQACKIITVHPTITEALGEKSFSSLIEVPGKIDLVNIFRRSEFVGPIVDQAIELKIPAVWMQEQVINQAAAEKARKAGMFIAMDLCILKEHQARFS